MSAPFQVFSVVLSSAGGENSEAEILQRFFYQEPHSYMTKGLGLMLWGFFGAEGELVIFQARMFLACLGFAG